LRNQDPIKVNEKSGLEHPFRDKYKHLSKRRNPLLFLCPDSLPVSYLDGFLTIVCLLFVGAVTTLSFSLVVGVMEPDSPNLSGLIAAICLFGSFLACVGLFVLSESRWERYVSTLSMERREEIARDLIEINTAFKLNPHQLLDMETRQKADQWGIECLWGMDAVSLNVDFIEIGSMKHARGILSDDLKDNLEALDFLVSYSEFSLSNHLKQLKADLAEVPANLENEIRKKSNKNKAEERLGTVKQQLESAEGSR